ncbi:MAG: hypothetical protein JSS15_11385 [Proteobacteria bacterium]|nr:hypothetical protein [Pseudomonadota bacterium]
MAGDANRGAGNKEFHQRRARQAFNMAEAAESPVARRLHLVMAEHHQRRATEVVDRIAPPTEV